MFRQRSQRPAPTWDRPKMLALLIGAALVACLVAVGLVLAVIYAVNPGRRPVQSQLSKTSATGRNPGMTARPTSSEDIHTARDALANRPMPRLDPELAKPGSISTRDPGELTIPKPMRAGPAGVPSGFPHTPAGALAQLAAIDQTALQAGNLAGARSVIADWAAEGGPTPETWSGTALLAQLLDSAGLSGGGSPQLAVAVTPLMGLIKGTVGPDFVIPCIDFEFDVTLTSTARAAIADCQRMVWTGMRWVIGSGPEPADPPSAWPDTDAAIHCGYKDLRYA